MYTQSFYICFFKTKSLVLFYHYFKKNYLFILATLGLSCGPRIFNWGMWNLVPWLGIEPGPSALGDRVLATGPSRKSHMYYMYFYVYIYKHFPGGTSGKESTSQSRRHKTQAWYPGWEDLSEEGMATHSSILTWRIPWTEEPAGLQSMGSQVVRHNWSDLASHTCLC